MHLSLSLSTRIRGGVLTVLQTVGEVRVFVLLLDLLRKADLFGVKYNSIGLQSEQCMHNTTLTLLYAPDPEAA